jgi:hypothetical protein
MRPLIRDPLDVWEAEHPDSPVLPPTSTPGQERYLPLFRSPEADLSGASDPPDMLSLIAELEREEWRDYQYRPLCREVLAAALRTNGFGIREATRALNFNVWRGPPPTSTLGQEKYVKFLGWSEDERVQIPDPPYLEHYVHAIEALGLVDELGRPLCRDVLLNALRVRYLNPERAARSLFAATRHLAPSTAMQTDEARAKAIADMESALAWAWNSDPSLN